MSAEALMITLLIAAAGLFWLAQPFMQRGSTLKGAELKLYKEREALLTSYERILGVIRDLDEDYNLGKLQQADYTAERASWAAQGAAVLEALEKLTGSPMRAVKTSKTSKAARQQPEPAEAGSDPDMVLDAAIEQAIAKYVEAKGGAGD